MIMVSSFYSVQYIYRQFSPHSFLSSGASTSTLRHLLSHPTDKYCVFAHNIRYLIHTNKND